MQILKAAGFLFDDQLISSAFRFLKMNEQEIKVIYEDEHIIVVDKPSGVLCVPSEEGIPSLAQTVCENFGTESYSMDKMVVHRLGMDTSGLVVFAKHGDALRGMNSLFRTRKVTREYEALVCGHVEQSEGMISMPLMRDYEFPPFMRVSTLEHQRVLIGLDATVVGKKLLEAPKACLTKFAVISRDELKGLPVTRLRLSSVSGRTHQLNVHCAAFGHPIVGDTVYGWNGDAAPNGGLDEETLSKTAPDRASIELQREIAQAAADMHMCIHAKSISFRHPITKEHVSFSSEPPF